MSSSTLTEIGKMIASTPGIKGGTPHITGTGVTVRTIVRWYKSGMSPEQIAVEYPHLGLAQVYAALAFYHANRAEMDAEMAAEEEESDKLEQLHQDYPYSLVKKSPFPRARVSKRNRAFPDFGG
jgi:uncharacterized protein (DUF433 family)